MNKARLLTAFLAGLPRVHTKWIDTSCAHFAARWVQTVEGVDVTVGVKPPASKADAARILRRAGGYEAFVTRQLGRDTIAAAYARLGDLVLLPLPDAEPGAMALGICAGNGVAAFMTE
ncbi:DUF6950 family protein, partial [Roseateles sp.]|uniref:DUF6950 family protein n=1 Tax=Roseateles sp. TaxID=1971397 RepID=UPI002F3E1E71